MAGKTSEEEAAGIKARRILVARLVERGVSKGIVADAFGVSYETIYLDLVTAKEWKVRKAMETLKDSLEESPSAAAPFAADLLKLAQRLPGGSE